MSAANSSATVEGIRLPPAGKGMAGADRVIPQVEQEEYEYEMNITMDGSGRDADDVDRYESLPPNFSLAANMAAGAFAGIAVSNTLQDAWERMAMADMLCRSTLSCIPSIC
jgi:hypothetical protein